MKKTCCFKPVSLGRTTTKFSSARYGERCLCISGLERETSIEDCIGDYIVVDDDPVSGKQVLVWKAKRGSKTIQGDEHYRAFSPKSHANNTERCPVRVYLKFASHSPDEMKKPDAPIFLVLNHSRAPDWRISNESC